ncbi:hypothetical protein HMN09_01121600 [Mycena chlorophos]|uniref:Uncharacterized protein n=1 Tax=Mycena chlorophos TaxID=658473 RepID=A0A8H6VZA5_MYCCL|nr:hypothetical protein HMN09_01121600 [Mycena chlorophos]
MPVKLEEIQQPHVVIIGTGMGGIAMAMALKRKGYENFTLIEKAASPGGTWRDNIYPGCSSDVAMHMYSFASELRPGWTHTHAFQPTILEYILSVFEKCDLAPHTLFNRTVLSAEWDTKKQAYRIASADTLTGQRQEGEIIAHVLVSAIGLLEIPRFPDIPGQQRFAGTTFHSARWDYGVDLKGKSVAVIGNGASATQFVPRISEDPSVQVTQYCRSPIWIFPPIREEYSRLHRFLLQWVPGWLRAYRGLHFAWTEVLYLAIFGNKFTNSILQSFLRSYMRRVAPAKYADKLIPTDPDFRLGCKRIVYDTNYLPSLARPNMELSYDAIQEITPEGIRTSAGTKKHDVIIYATGYVTDTYSIPVKGTTDQTVKQYFDAHGGPTAYLGTAVPGFPNFFTLAGANTATGHTSLLFAMEVQVAYLLKLLAPILFSPSKSPSERRLTSIEPTASATDAYNTLLHRRLSTFIWARCTSWYRTGTVSARTGEKVYAGKIHGLFPGSMTLFWWWMRKVRWGDYKVVLREGDGEGGLQEGTWRPRRSVGRKVGFAVFVLALVAALGVLGWPKMRSKFTPCC